MALFSLVVRGASRKLAAGSQPGIAPSIPCAARSRFDANVMARRSSLLLRVVCNLGARRQGGPRETGVRGTVAARTPDWPEHGEKHPLEGWRRAAKDDHV